MIICCVADILGSMIIRLPLMENPLLKRAHYLMESAEPAWPWVNNVKKLPNLAQCLMDRQLPHKVLPSTDTCGPLPPVVPQKILDMTSPVPILG